MSRFERHGRLTAVTVLAAVAAAMGAAALAHPGTARSVAAGAAAVAAWTGDEPSGSVSADPSRHDNTTTCTATASTGPAQFANATVTVSSFVSGSALVSSSEATVSGIDLFAGRVTADTVHVKLLVTAGTAGVTALVVDDTVSGLKVDGLAVAPGDSLDVASLGVLSCGDSSREASGDSASAQATGLRLVLDTDTAGLPAGTVVVIGSASAAVDEAAYRVLTGISAPTPTPSATPRTAKPSPKSTPAPSANPPVQPSGGQTSPTMPPPTASSAQIVDRFPGAVFPVVGRCYYTDDFGAYRADIASHQHEGNDIFAPQGAPVVAVQDGVVESSTAGIGGNNIHLTNSRGDYFYYAHLSRFAGGLETGAHVLAGQTLGYVGTTGDAQGTSPHLHFEIHPGGGAAVDPYPYLEAWRAAGHVISTGTDENGGRVSGGFDPSLLAERAPDKRSNGPAVAAALDQIATTLADLDTSLPVDRGKPAGRTDPLVATLIALNSLGAMALKRLHLAALLFP